MKKKEGMDAQAVPIVPPKRMLYSLPSSGDRKRPCNTLEVEALAPPKNAIFFSFPLVPKLRLGNA